MVFAHELPLRVSHMLVIFPDTFNDIFDNTLTCQELTEKVLKAFWISIINHKILVDMKQVVDRDFDH